MKRPLTVIDIFSGVGGISLGFMARGFRLLGAVEVDQDAAAAFHRNTGVRPIIEDIRNLRGGDLRNMKHCAVLVGCAPCQSFTSMRRNKTLRKIDRDHNALPDSWIDVISLVRPRHVVFENVPGIMTAKGGTIFSQMKLRLKKMGYSVAYGVEDAANFGVPQHRKRLLLIGSTAGIATLPARTHGDPETEDVKAGRLAPWSTVRDAIGALPRLGPGERDEHDAYHAAPNHSNLVLRRLRAIEQGEGHMDLPKKLRLRCHVHHSGHRDVYGRMWWDSPAPTLTGGCTNVTRGRFAHPDQDRAISLREAMLLQTFPRKTVLHGTVETMAQQVGNAVPVLLAKRIADQILLLERHA